MSRVARLYAVIGESMFHFEPAHTASVVTKEHTFTDPDWLYAYATRLMAAADKLRAAQR